MQMSQVWSKADFDGLNETGHKGGYGSVLAVTGQNPGPDGQFNTADDVLAPLNVAPVDVSIDASPGPVCGDPMDRVRGFYSLHSGGANFLVADGSIHFVTDDISRAVYLGFSTISEAEPIAGSGS
jgi:prepilin-type processing-associated H-X9-DG protein|tara:strand:+ start:682 stop:1056 length:375 start_codon:yes stop_codon:yes gene_type:complete